MRRLQASAKAFWWTASLAATINNNDGPYLLLLLCSAIQSVISEDPDKSPQLEMAYIKLEGEECIPVQDSESSGRVMINKASAARSAHLAVSSDTSMKPDVGILLPFKRKAERRLSPGKMSRRWRRNRPNNDANNRNKNHNVLNGTAPIDSPCEGSLECAKDGSSSLGGRCVPKKHPEDEMGSIGNRRGLQPGKLRNECFESCPSVTFCQCRYRYNSDDDIFYGVCLSYIVAVCDNKPIRDDCFVGNLDDHRCAFFTCRYEGGLIQHCLCLYRCNPKVCDCIQTVGFDPSCVDPVADMCNSGYTYNCSYDDSYFFGDCTYYDSNVFEHTSCPLYTCLASGKSEAVCRCVGFKSSCDYFKLSSRQKAQYYCAVADCCGKATTDEQRSSCFLKELITKREISPSLPPSPESRHPSQCPPSCQEDVCDCAVSKNYSPECISLLAQECRSQSKCKQGLFGNGELPSVCIGHICIDEGGSNNECSCKQITKSCNLGMDGKLGNDTVCVVADCCEKAIDDDGKGMCLEVFNNHTPSTINDTSKEPTPAPISSTQYGANITNMKPNPPTAISTKATSSSSMYGDLSIILVAALAGVFMMIFAL